MEQVQPHNDVSSASNIPDTQFIEMRSLREDIAELERRNEDLTKDIVNLEAALETERNTNQDLSVVCGDARSHDAFESP